MIANSPPAVAAAFSGSPGPVSLGESRCAAIPEPINSAARNALPRNSAASRRHSGAGTGPGLGAGGSRRGMPVRLTSGRLTVVDVILATSDRRLSMGGLVTATREPALLPVADDASCGPVVAMAPLRAGEEAAALASVLSALADPVRLRLLSVVAAQGEVCSCHLQEPLGKSQPTISHHTRVLADAGLIEGDKRGKWTWWRIVT